MKLALSRRNLWERVPHQVKIALGGALEILQAFTGRETALADAIANSVGVLCGGFLGRAIVEPLHRRYVSNAGGTRV